MGHVPSLSTIPGNLPPRLGEYLRACGHIARFKRGYTVISGGGSSCDVYVVLEGMVQVVLFSANGRDVILRTIGPGGLFGEYAAIDGGSRSATVVTLGDCVLVRISGKDFRDGVEHVPGAALWMAQHLVGQIRTLTSKLFELSSLAVRNRLHCELLRLAGTRTTSGASIMIEPAPTHQELASRIGTHREAVTREMRYLADHGVLEQQRRRLVILDVHALTVLVRDAIGDHESYEEIGQAAKVPRSARLVAAFIG